VASSTKTDFIIKRNQEAANGLRELEPGQHPIEILDKVGLTLVVMGLQSGVADLPGAERYCPRIMAELSLFPTDFMLAAAGWCPFLILFAYPDADTK
jgi:hypothetical protein